MVKVVIRRAMRNPVRKLYGSIFIMFTLSPFLNFSESLHPKDVPVRLSERGSVDVYTGALKLELHLNHRCAHMT